MSGEEYKKGDPRRIVEIFSGTEPDRVPIDEYLWGCKTANDSLRMSKILVSGGWLAITIMDRGNVVTKRTPHYCYGFQNKKSDGVTVVRGHFLFDFTNSKDLAQTFGPTLLGWVHFQKDSPSVTYEFLTPREISEVSLTVRAIPRGGRAHNVIKSGMIDHLTR